jgi:hypothetical protein
MREMQFHQILRAESQLGKSKALEFNSYYLFLKLWSEEAIWIDFDKESTDPETGYYVAKSSGPSDTFDLSGIPVRRLCYQAVTTSGTIYALAWGPVEKEKKSSGVV